MQIEQFLYRLQLYNTFFNDVEKNNNYVPDLRAKTDDINDGEAHDCKRRNVKAVQHHDSVELRLLSSAGSVGQGSEPLLRNLWELICVYSYRQLNNFLKENLKPLFAFHISVLQKNFNF